MAEIEYNPILVDLIDVPSYGGFMRTKVWLPRFKELPEGKAAVLKYNNRQRAHTARNAIVAASHYNKIKIHTRVIHAEPAIHETDGWLLYFWKNTEEK